VTLQNPDPNRLVSVFENIDASLLWIARDELASVGIESFILGEITPRMIVVTRMAMPARLMVYADKAGEALECLRDLGFKK
jgi:hypothetical protein